MPLNRNSNLAGLHAVLSPSTYHWLDYDEDKLAAYFFAKQQARRGDQEHALAKTLIEMRIKLPDNEKTLNQYVNDAIGFRMSPEITLRHSDICFGTTDAIGINSRESILRIHDLKTGTSPTKMTQLIIYAGLFFLEYEMLYHPRDIRVLLRIYQNNAFEEFEPSVPDLLLVIDRIRTQAAIVARLREEEM
jgi:hypothetical protein